MILILAPRLVPHTRLHIIPLALHAAPAALDATLLVIHTPPRRLALDALRAPRLAARVRLAVRACVHAAERLVVHPRHALAEPVAVREDALVAAAVAGGEELGFEAFADLAEVVAAVGRFGFYSSGAWCSAVCAAAYASMVYTRLSAHSSHQVHAPISS